MQREKRAKIAYWSFTILFCLMMSWTVYAQLCMPEVAKVFAHLGYPDYFRLELCSAKILGLLVLILPMAPWRLKEWAYCGFAIVLVSALISHLAVGDGPAAWVWSVGYFVLGALSYFSFHLVKKS